VLFEGAASLEQTVYDAILAASAEASPLDAALTGMAATGALLDEIRDRAAQRSRIIAANRSLQERELLKLAAMTEATARALRRRGVTELEATLAAHSAITVFHVAFARWVSTDDPLAFAVCVADAATALRALI
jgi:hypothetical protein